MADAETAAAPPPPSANLAPAYERIVEHLNPSGSAPGFGAAPPQTGDDSRKRKARTSPGGASPDSSVSNSDNAENELSLSKRLRSESPESSNGSEHSELALADGFAVHVPLAPLTRHRNLLPSAIDARLAAQYGTAPRMLIADDSYTVRRFMQRTFEQRGYAVDVAQNGWQAFAQMQTRLYDFVFLDIEMPVMNGYRCAQALRQWEARVQREERQFICALTSHSKPAERELGIGIGMNLFESKPARPKRLLDIVEQALNAANGDATAAAAIAAAATAVACGPTGAGVLDLDGEPIAAPAARAAPDEPPPAFDLEAHGLGADDKACLALCTSHGLVWIDVKVTADAAGGAFDVEATDGSGICARGVPRRRLKLPDQTPPKFLEPGAHVDAIVGGAFKAAVVEKRLPENAYDLTVDGGAALAAVPRDQILATHE